MNLTAIKTGDVVYCNVRGKQFWAQVTGKEKGVLSIMPITNHVNHYSVKAREVVTHFSKRGRA